MSQTKKEKQINELLKNFNAEISNKNLVLRDNILCDIILEIGKTQANVGRKLLKQNPNKFYQHFVVEHILTLREEMGQTLMEQISNDLQCISNFVEPLKNKAEAMLEVLKKYD